MSKLIVFAFLILGVTWACNAQDTAEIKAVKKVKPVKPYPLNDTTLYLLKDKVYTGENIRKMEGMSRGMTISGAVFTPLMAGVVTTGIAMLIKSDNLREYVVMRGQGQLLTVYGGAGLVGGAAILITGLTLQAKWRNIKNKILLDPIVMINGVAFRVRF